MLLSDYSNHRSLIVKIHRMLIINIDSSYQKDIEYDKWQILSFCDDTFPAKQENRL